MNIYSIILGILALLIILSRVKRGYKKGFVNELSVCIAIVIAVIVGRILLDSYEALASQKISHAVYRLLMLGVVFGIYKLISLVLSAAKLFSKLPVINWLDKILGAVIGVVEGYFLIRFIIIIIKGWIT